MQANFDEDIVETVHFTQVRRGTLTGCRGTAGGSVKAPTQCARPTPAHGAAVQAALGAKPKPGAHVVFVEKDGEKFAIGTLDGARCAQFSCDVTFAMDEVTLSHSGAGEVHLTGYRVEQMLAGASEDEDGYGYGVPQGAGWLVEAPHGAWGRRCTWFWR